MPRRAHAIQAPAPSGYRLLFVLALAGFFSSGISPSAMDEPAYRGRRLVDVLHHLQRGGLNVIFSSAVVDGKTLVTVEPSRTEPRALLAEILPPLALEARDGPGGSVLIVRASIGALRGRVISAAGGTPLGGAAVRVLGSRAGAFCAPDGTFDIGDVPAGTHDVEVDAPGYQPRILADVAVPGSGSERLVVRLEARPAYLEEVVVTPGRLSLIQQEQDSRLTVTDEEIPLTSVARGDVSRVVEMLPGVAAPDNSAAFNVRGSQVQDVSFVLDGLELYEPFHLPRFQSPFSLVDSDIVERVDFLSGPFTADFGDRHGGIVKVSTLAPDDVRRIQIGAGNLNSRVSYVGPMPWRDASWRASARSWYPERRGSLDNGEPGLEPTFGDAYLNATFRVSPRAVLAAHGLLAFDRVALDEPTGDRRVEASSESGYLWLRSMNSWNEHLASETVLSLGRLDHARRGSSAPQGEMSLVEDNRVVDFLGLKHDATWRVSDAHLLKAGLDARSLIAEYRYRAGPADDPASIQPLALEPSGVSLGGYVAYRAAVTSRLAAEVGARWDRQSYTDESQFSPRLSALWRLGERSELRFGVGRYFQSQRIHELRIEDGQTDFLPAELSREAGLTFEHRFQADLRFRLDAYWRDLSRLRPRHENLLDPGELFPEIEPDRVTIDADRAVLRGFELLLHSGTARPFSWMASYARSSAEDVIDGRGVPRSWDQTHAGRFLIVYRIAERWILSLGGVAHTGWPTTPVSATVVSLPGGGTRFDPVFGERNSERFPYYLRLDATASRAFALPGGSLRVDVGILNLTNRENPCCTDGLVFLPRADGSVGVDRELESWPGMTPTFRLVWEF